LEERQAAVSPVRLQPDGCDRLRWRDVETRPKFIGKLIEFEQFDEILWLGL